MTPSYLVRLLLLSSASFFIVQLVASALVALFAPAAIRRAAAMRPIHAAQWLLTLRLLPTALAAIFLAALCVPSYLRFEPQIAGETVGVACLAAAILGGSISSLAIYRSLSALIRSSLYLRRCRGRVSLVEGEKVWIVGERAGLALAGILYPRLLISERALTGLSSDELSVAMRHEHAHRASRDNLKRFLILLAPAVFPALRTLETAWAKYAEWSADDRASEGDAGRSVALASALVQVARLQSCITMPMLVTSLVGADEDLSLRVHRLLNAAPAQEPASRDSIALAGVSLIIAIVAMNPDSLRIVHHLLEYLLD